jgi:hypothetical protein
VIRNGLASFIPISLERGDRLWFVLPGCNRLCRRRRRSAPQIEERFDGLAAIPKRVAEIATPLIARPFDVTQRDGLAGEFRADRAAEKFSLMRWRRYVAGEPIYAGANRRAGEAGRRSEGISWIEGDPIGALGSPRVSG